MRDVVQDELSSLNRELQKIKTEKMESRMELDKIRATLAVTEEESAKKTRELKREEEMVEAAKEQLKNLHEEIDKVQKKGPGFSRFFPFR
uniref:Uncharacterized protein n=1 Tax=Hanusia phi TaxID=3032 RepID=A0A7S0E710_9CRYP